MPDMFSSAMALAGSLQKQIDDLQSALTAERAARERAEQERERDAPIDMLLFCPQCGLQHVDARDPDGHTSVEISGRETRWENPPHRSHLCHGCGHIWRPCDRETNGVASLTTQGKADGSPVPQSAAPPTDEDVERVGRAIYEAMGHTPDQATWEQLHDAWKDECRIEARAAIEALRGK